MNWKETDDIWRLYHREWVAVQTLPTRHGDEDGRPAFDEAVAWINANLTDRVRQGDSRVQLNTDNNGTFWAVIEVFKDNLKGEFKYVSLAQRHAHEQGYDEYVIVPRNSKSDHEIRNYGVVRM